MWPQPDGAGFVSGTVMMCCVGGVMSVPGQQGSWIVVICILSGQCFWFRVRMASSSVWECSSVSTLWGPLLLAVARAMRCSAILCSCDHWVMCGIHTHAMDRKKLLACATSVI